MTTLVILAAVISLGVLANYFSRERRIRRKLLAAKRWPIGELPENVPGRVVGRAGALTTTVTAPLTGRVCFYYAIYVEVQSDDSWKRILHESSGTPFLLEDHTGRAVVDPTAAQVTIRYDHERETGSTVITSMPEDELLARHGTTSQGFWGRKSLRFYEAVISNGHEIAVLGSGIREPDLGRPSVSAYREAPATLLRLTSSARHPLLISDHPETLGPD